MLKRMRNGGFSLVELIIVIAILAVLAALLTPSFIYVNQEARLKKDLAKFESMNVAFKSALSEPEVVKDNKQFTDNGSLTLVFSIDDEGNVIFGKGIIKGNIKSDTMETSKLWLNSYQRIGTTYKLDHTNYYGKYLVFDIVLKTTNTTATCQFHISDSMP